MRTNLPVTQTELFLEPGKPIVTKTDTHGRITYANAAFVRISGYTAEELIGESHNIVRHPDMPSAAFADLWATIKRGQPWQGLVKNRSKEGHFYWVDAFVTPIVENGRTTGYMSVRNTPERKDIEHAERLYRDAREGRATLSATPRLPELSSLGRMLWPATLAILVLLVAGAFSLLEFGAALGWGLIGLAGLGVMSLPVWMQHALLGPLKLVQQGLAAVDEGRLAQRIPVAGSRLDALLAQVEALRIHQRATFADVLVASRDVASRSTDLDGSIAELQETSGNQSAQVMQVAAAMEQMSVSVNEISANTGQSLEASEATDQAAQASRAAMDVSTQSVLKVVEAVGQARTTITDMVASIARIGEFAQLIKEIADQTNLLALNAAIEAARAGESGRGFAVVADEVRKLAERTAQSTADIASAVQAVETRASGAVTGMDAATDAVNQSTASIEATALSMEQISAASRRATSLAQDVRRMLEQQSAASHEVAGSMEALAALVERNHRTVGEVASTMHGLRDTSGELHGLVRHLESAL